MPAGGLGDHPLTDLLHHGRHPFPKDMEEALQEILSLDPIFPDGPRPHLDQLRWEQRFWDWQAGKNLDEGRTALREVLQKLRHRPATGA